MCSVLSVHFLDTHFRSDPFKLVVLIVTIYIHAIPVNQVARSLR